MNVKERRERKAKKHADYLARLKAQDEKNRGVVPEKVKEPEKVETKPEVESIPELKFSTQSKETSAPVEAPAPQVQVLAEEVLPESEEPATDDSEGPVEEPEPVQEEISSEDLEAPVLEGKKKKGGRKKK